MLKKIVLLFSAVLVLSFFAFIVVKLSDKVDLLQTFIPEKIAVFRNVRMSGMEGEHRWEISADEAWTGRDRNTTTLEFVKDADIYKGDRLFIKGLNARRLTMTKSKDIEIFRKANEEKGGKQYLSLLIDFNAISNRNKKSKFSTLTADDIKFNPHTKKALINGDIRIKKDRLLIRSENIALDLDGNMATFESRSTFSRDGSRMTANSAVADFDVDKISMAGSVEVFQKNKTAASDRAVYDDKAKTIELSSRVSAIIEKLKHIIKEKTAKKVKGEEAKAALQEKTVITCDKLVLSTEKGDCRAYGKVLVAQKGKEARSDEAFYHEDSENIILTGNVYMKQRSNWVSANKVIVSVDKEIFEAIGNVETTFNVKKGSRR